MFTCSKNNSMQCVAFCFSINPLISSQKKDHVASNSNGKIADDKVHEEHTETVDNIKKKKKPKALKSKKSLKNKG